MRERRGAPARPTGMPFHLRGPVLLVAMLLLAGCGADDGATREASSMTPSPASTDAPGPSQPALPSPSAPASRPGGAAAVPHADEGVGRTGEVATRRASCVMDGTPDFSFDGTVAEIGDGEVTFAVTESFRGELPATYTVEMGAPVTGRASESAPSYSVGTRLLVSGADGVAWGCGATVYYDEELAAERRS